MAQEQATDMGMQKDDSVPDYEEGSEHQTPTKDSSSDQDALLIANKEGTRIRAFRWTLVGMLLIAGAVTILGYFLLRSQENTNFETAYNQFARTVTDAAIDQQLSLRESMDSFAHELTAYGQQNNLTWPYVRLPLFESYASKYFQHSHGEFVMIDNYVTHEERESYINWTNQHYKEWIEESHIIRYGNLDRLNQNTSKYNPYISQKAKGIPPDEIRPYYSVRTDQSPPARAYGPLFNMNVATLPGTGIIKDGVYSLKYETLITPLKPYTALPDDEHKNFHADSNADNPHSFMVSPIYERVQDPTLKIVGSISTAVAWDRSMQNLLPENVKGILSVVKNNCNQSFTYEIRGPDAYYLGDGDQHDTQFQDLEVEVDLSFHTHPDFASTPGHCMYTMHIFPTEDFEAQYHTNLPVAFAVIVFSTFALVAIVFLLYDFYMQRRNSKITKDAARSDNVLASLFPGEIKDEVLMQHNMQRGDESARGFKHPGDEEKVKMPLAREYESTTIFFGDLAGFTKWSSTRSPEQVFELLEHLYSTFDKMAKARGVFKVETIGDCYVAATGLPKPQEDHAVRMVRFANGLMGVMNSLTNELVDRLGPDTTDLRLRVGLHSGNITGGVLKGDKSRFQLFGDTMNTASRMESNGVPGRIHVSKTTADELTFAGKHDWLTERKDKIVAKGKGEMHTFFVLIPASGSQTTVAESCTFSVDPKKDLEMDMSGNVSV